ncbi:MAG: ACT domain-containing protein [Actinomycetota bacterium]
MQLNLLRHTPVFFVYKLEKVIASLIEKLNSQNDFWSLTISPKEVSVVCSLELQESVQSKEGPWVLYEVEGPLDFSLTGILVAVAKPLAEAGISIFAISSHDTDFVLVKKEMANQTERVWEESGFKVSKT